MMQVDWWSWKCLRCGWAVESQRTVNNQQSVAEAIVRCHIEDHQQAEAHPVRASASAASTLQEEESFNLEDVRARSKRWQTTCYDTERCIEEIDRLREEIAVAREACPSIRMQDHSDAPLLALINLEVSRGFNRDAEIERLRASAASTPQEELQQLGRLIQKAALNITSPADDAIIDALIEIQGLLRAALASQPEKER